MTTAKLAYKPPKRPLDKELWLKLQRWPKRKFHRMAPTLENTIGDRLGIGGSAKPIYKPEETIEEYEVKPVEPAGEFSKMLDRLERAFSRSQSSVDVDEVWRLLEDYKSNQADWAKFAFYDVTGYKRNLVAEYEKYNVMIITWAPGSRSCIHDHAGSHCFMKVLDGQLVEGRFAWPDQKSLSGQKSQAMSRVKDTRMCLDDIVYIHDKVGLHLVENPSRTKSAASLHVYIPPYRECKAFDPRTGRAVECEVKFHSKSGRIVDGEKIDERKIGIEKTGREKYEC